MASAKSKVATGGYGEELTKGGTGMKFVLISVMASKL